MWIADTSKIENGSDKITLLPAVCVCVFRVGTQAIGKFCYLLSNKTAWGEKDIVHTIGRWCMCNVSWILYLHTTHKIHMIFCAGAVFLFFCFRFGEILRIATKRNCWWSIVRSTHIVSSFNQFTCMMHTMHTHDSHNCQLKWDASDGKLYV